MGLHLAEATLYRVDAGGAPALLARWPAGAAPGALPGPLAAQAVESRSRVVSGKAVAIPIFTRDGTPHLFVGRVGRAAAHPGAAAWRTLEIMLHEASIALANVELFTEIREAHERLAAILSGVADRMMIVDREMRVVWMNPAAAAGGSIGRTCFEIMGTTAEGCVACPAVRTFQSGQVERGVRAQPCVGGPTRYLDLITAPLRDASGHVHQVLEVARDVTELVEMEERLKATNQALLDAQAQLVERQRLAAVGQLVVGLHHSILNPLTGILGALQVLKQMPGGEPEQARTIAAAEEEIRKIERLVRRLPELQRTEEIPYLGGTTMLDLERSCSNEGESPPGPAAG
jgi:PAS domain S-box-containing protein